MKTRIAARLVRARCDGIDVAGVHIHTCHCNLRGRFNPNSSLRYVNFLPPSYCYHSELRTLGFIGYS